MMATRGVLISVVVAVGAAAAWGGAFAAEGVRPGVVREWAAEVVSVWGHLTPGNAVGPVDGAIAKGWPGGGQLTVRFEHGIRNRAGADFAVWENGFEVTDPNFPEGGLYVELGYVDVSSDGVHWATFPSVYLEDPNLATNPAPNIDPTNVYNLAGNYVAGYVPIEEKQGTPFDLEDLRDRAEVIAGQVDLAEIRYVRLRDIVGVEDGGANTDEATYFGYARNHVIADGRSFAGGADWDAVGAIHSVLSPGDFDENGVVDGVDLAMLAGAWLVEASESGWEEGRYDISEPADSVVNWRDFAVLAGDWLRP